MTDDRSREPSDHDLDEDLVRAFITRGELLPTTTESVLEASGSTKDVELPKGLEELYSTPEEVAPAPATRRRDERGARVRVLPYVAAFAAIAAAAALFFMRPTGPNIHDDPRKGAPGAVESGAPPVESAVLVPIAPPTCDAECCAGAACKTAEPLLASCPTERTCIPCSGNDEADARYRLRLGNYQPKSGGAGPEALAMLDLCVSVASGAWSCEPAFLPASARPRGRFLPSASRAAELGAGVAIELRIRGKTSSYAAWRSSIKVGASSLCRGVSVVLENDQHEQLGSLSMFLERTFFVELGRRESRAALDELASAFSFGAATPAFLTAPGDPRGRGHVLALGPYDRPEAERVLAAVRRETADGPLAEELRLDVGDGYEW
ncbi:MAG: hypothetical protein U0271_26405 [Polyangiaceae bacterium]